MTETKRNSLSRLIPGKYRRKIGNHRLYQKWLKDREDRNYLKQRQSEIPELKWELGPRCPQVCVEANRAQVGHLLHLFGGYVHDCATMSRKHHQLNLKTGKWTDMGPVPELMPETHNAIISDNKRYIYSVSGQLGPHCSPSVPYCFKFDMQTHEWSRLPDLPESRYMPMIFFNDDRIHVIGGSMPDRCSPAEDYWTLHVKNGVVMDEDWQMQPIKVDGRTHTPCLYRDDEFYIFGGQKGDVPPVEGCEEYFCQFEGTKDLVLDIVQKVNLETGSVTELSPMPLALSHTEYSIVEAQDKIIITSGTLHRTVLNDQILMYDISNDEWSIIGKTPHAMKKTCTAYYNGWLYIIAGQNAKCDLDRRPGIVTNTVWRARIDHLL